MTARNLPDRVSVGAAFAWIDEHVGRLGAEEASLAAAVGRALAQDVAAATDAPSFDRASLDGIAVRADETVGASVYNPLTVGLAATQVNSGDALPRGADAVAPLDHVELDAASGTCNIIEAVASGTGVERAASQAARGTVLLHSGRILVPPDIGLLASAGAGRVAVIRRPRVRVVLAGRRLIDAGAASASPAIHDVDGPLLETLIERDGGVVTEAKRVDRDRAALRAALSAQGSDIIVLAGGTGRGPDDEAAAALAEVGDVAIHGIALEPGGSSGIGETAAGVPVVLLPGTPAACLWSYEFFAGRAIRRLGGRNPALPYRLRRMTTARKIVSVIGMTEVCPVRLRPDGCVEPLPSFAEAGIAVASRADGFVVIAEGSEGLAQGSVVAVHLYDRHDAAEGAALIHD